MFEFIAGHIKSLCSSSSPKCIQTYQTDAQQQMVNQAPQMAGPASQICSKSYGLQSPDVWHSQIPFACSHWRKWCSVYSVSLQLQSSSFISSEAQSAVDMGAGIYLGSRCQHLIDDLIDLDGSSALQGSSLSSPAVLAASPSMHLSRQYLQAKLVILKNALVAVGFDS